MEETKTRQHGGRTDNTHTCTRTRRHEPARDAQWVKKSTRKQKNNTQKAGAVSSAHGKTKQKHQKKRKTGKGMGRTHNSHTHAQKAHKQQVHRDTGIRGSAVPCFSPMPSPELPAPASSVSQQQSEKPTSDGAPRLYHRPPFLSPYTRPHMHTKSSKDVNRGDKRGQPRCRPHHSLPP